jgi:hypothetical protein
MVSELKVKAVELQKQLEETQEQILIETAVEKLRNESVGVTNNMLQDVVMYKLAGINPEERYMLQFKINGKTKQVRFSVSHSEMLFSKEVEHIIAKAMFEEILKSVSLQNF